MIDIFVQVGVIHSLILFSGQQESMLIGDPIHEAMIHELILLERVSTDVEALRQLPRVVVLVGQLDGGGGHTCNWMQMNDAFG